VSAGHQIVRLVTAGGLTRGLTFATHGLGECHESTAAERRLRLATAIVLGLVALLYGASEIPALLDELR
jgi:hypothetical protein